MPRRDDLPKGALSMTLSALLFAVMGACVKLAAASLPNAVVVFLRSALSLLALLPFALRPGGPTLATRKPLEHLLRGLAGLLAMYCLFYAIARLRLADAMLLNYTLPLFVPFIERAWLGEPISPRIWPGITLGFAGLLLILRPGAGVFEPAALLALLSALLAALAQVGVRNLTRSEPVTRIVFYFLLISALGALPWAALEWRAPQPGLAVVLLVMGATGALGQLFMTRAYSLAPAARVGPFVYSAVVFAGFFDWLLWRKLPDLSFVLGALLVCAAAIVMLRLARRPEPLEA